MVSRHSRFTLALLALMAIFLMMLVYAVALAQDTDGRINVGVHIGGAAVYCVDATRAAAASYASGGGILVRDSSGGELLFVPEAAINAGFEQVAQTGQYATLGVSERLWYGNQPVALYLLSSEEFQLNAYEEHGKLVEFRWTECAVPPPPPISATPTCNRPDCRDYSRGTGDGCLPGWDWSEVETSCVYRNLY